jgi:hypothetical protein
MIAMTRGAVLFVLASLIVRTGLAFSQPVEIAWPDAVAQLAGERSKAETCVALIKKYGSDAQIAHGQLTYTDAKADSDAVICRTYCCPFLQPSPRNPFERAG